MSSKQKIFIASDHAGLQLKKHLVKTFSEYEWIDYGAFDESSVDYPDFADKVAQSIKQSSDRGLLICGSGQGMAMRANKYQHIRAALCWNVETTKLSREHNDANVLCLGGRMLSTNDAEDMIRIFLKTEFAGGRHQNRVNKLSGPTNC